MPGSILNGIWPTRALFFLFFMVIFFQFFPCDCNCITACFPFYSPNPPSLLALFQIMSHFLLVIVGSIYVLSAFVCTRVRTCMHLFILKNNLLTLYNVFSMYVFRNYLLVLDNQLVCSPLGKTHTQHFWIWISVQVYCHVIIQLMFNKSWRWDFMGIAFDIAKRHSLTRNFLLNVYFKMWCWWKINIYEREAHIFWCCTIISTEFSI